MTNTHVNQDFWTFTADSLKAAFQSYFEPLRKLREWFSSWRSHAAIQNDLVETQRRLVQLHEMQVRAFQVELDQTRRELAELMATQLRTLETSSQLVEDVRQADLQSEEFRKKFEEEIESVKALIRDSQAQARQEAALELPKALFESLVSLQDPKSSALVSRPLSPLRNPKPLWKLHPSGRVTQERLSKLKVGSSSLYGAPLSTEGFIIRYIAEVLKRLDLDLKNLPMPEGRF